MAVQLSMQAAFPHAYAPHDFAVSVQSPAPLHELARRSMILMAEQVIPRVTAATR